jgi:hypothetical protein
MPSSRRRHTRSSTSAARSRSQLGGYGPRTREARFVGAHLRARLLGRTIEFVSGELVPRDELEAAIEARKELGAEMEPAVIDAFVERIERRIVQRAEESERSLRRRREHQKEMVLGAMGISIPLLAIAAIFTGLAGVIVVCGALAVIAIVTAIQR